jgi:hypothetical protein
MPSSAQAERLANDALTGSGVAACGLARTSAQSVTTAIWPIFNAA